MSEQKELLPLSLNEYQELAGRTEKALPPDWTLVHHAMGMGSEAGEVLTQVKAHVIYGKPLDAVNILEECGDTLWFIARLLARCNYSLEDCAIHNINKLCVRYPDRYADQLALQRLDKQGESNA